MPSCPSRTAAGGTGVPDDSSGLRLEVVGIGADGVELRASEEVALVNTTGGIDLADPTDQLTVPAQGELRFATATTDAGWRYVVARR